MSKNAIAVLATVVLGLSTAAALGQTQTQTTTTTTVTRTTQNPDGTYSIVEYPVGKEVNVTLNPINLPGGKAVATVLRDDSGTRIKLNLTGLPPEVAAVNLYAVDPNGTVTLLGPVNISDGTGTFESTTSLSKFMLIASPEANLSTYDPKTRVFFRSSVPTGFAVIPYASHGDRRPGAVGERVSATTSPGMTPAQGYNVPMLNIPAFRPGTDTHMRVNFSGALTGARANIFIEPRKDGPTEIKVRFHELKDAPSGQVYVLWAVSPDNKFVKLGQIVNARGRNEAEIKSETSLPDFGLLITMEDATARGESASPLGPALGIVELGR